MQRADPLFKLRLPRDLRALLEEAAMQHGRSVTAEILARLGSTFPAQPDKVTLLEAQLVQLAERVLQLEKLMAAISRPQREE